MNEQLSAPAPPDQIMLEETLQGDWVTACWTDMQRRQSAGQRFAAEDYLSPPYSDSDKVINLAYGEFNIRKAAGETVDSKEFLRRFPLQAEELERQFAMEELLSTDDSVPNAHLHAQSTIANHVPGKFGRYLVLEKLASGGQAVVYRCLHPDLRIEVAVKVSRCESKNAEVNSSELVEEARILAKLHHPNIARVIDLGTCEDGAYLVSEYIAGRTLDQFASDQPVSAIQAAAIIAKIAHGLEAAHRQSVVHLDVKPRNIMIDERGEPRLIDFGLAIRRGNRFDRLAQLSGLRGTVQFMPPEQAKADNVPLGPRSDIYALGGVLYFLLTGKLPYGEGRWPEMLEKARLGAWRREELARVDIPRPMRSICERALSFHVSERFETAAQMAAELEQAVNRRPVSRSLIIVTSLLFGIGSVLAWQLIPGTGLLNSPNTSLVNTPESLVSANELELEVWNDGRFLRLANMVPLKSGDRLKILGHVPSNHFASLFVFTSEGNWRLLTQVAPLSETSAPEVRQLRFPNEEHHAVPLNGAPGTEVVVLCSRPVKPIELSEWTEKYQFSAPWPHLPAMTVLRADSKGVALVQQGRDFGTPVATPDSESEIRSKLDAIRDGCKEMPGFTAVAFYRE